MKGMVPYCASNLTLPSGYLGARAQGYRDGQYCGQSSWSYSNVAAWGWQVWVWACSNPSGLQEFYTRANGKLWVNNSQYDTTGWQLSPIQQY